MYSLFATPGTFAPLFLRVSLLGIFFYHGAQKAFGWFGGAGWQATVQAWSSADGGSFLPVVTSSFIVVELVLPLFLLLGFLTRPAGLIVVILMVGDLYYAAGEGGFVSLELPMMMLAAGLALLFAGGGYLSVDRGISQTLLPYVGDNFR